MWCNTCFLILSKAVSWCSLGTPALHLPAFAEKVSFSTAGMWYSHYTASYDTWWELILWSCWRPEASWLPEAKMVTCSSNLRVTEYFSVVVTYGSFLVSTWPKFLETGQNLLFVSCLQSRACTAPRHVYSGNWKNHWTALLIVLKTEKWVETVSQLSSKAGMSLSFFFLIIKIHLSLYCLLWIFVS